jgi:hypothetical protein
MANVGALDQIRTFLREHPDVHDQSTFSCGTTACVAGWAIALHRGARYGERMDPVVCHDDNDDDAIEAEARDLLGLTDRETQALFYETCSAPRPERQALDLIDAIIAWEKDDLADEQRTLLHSYMIPAGAE